MKNNGSLNIFKNLKMINISKFSDIKKKENFEMFYNYENYENFENYFFLNNFEHFESYIHTIYIHILRFL